MSREILPAVNLAKLKRANPYGQGVSVGCPKCRRRTRAKLLETKEGGRESIRRVRQCLECGAKFSTYERIEEKRPMDQGEIREKLQIAYAALGTALEKMR
jgi:5-methylcytosine-specific restriction endonuclease McrA